METFTPWTLFTDLSLILLLILVGKLIRAKLRFVQSLFIPASLMGGLLGLILGPNGFGILPFSSFISVYPAILIAVVFGALPLSSPKVGLKTIAKRVGPMWAYSQFGMLFQWGLMGLLGILVFAVIWPELNPAFGVMLPTGFYGGHGTAAAIGTAFDGLGWSDAASLGMTTATIGVILAVVGGILFIKLATKRGDTRYITDFQQLPQELRSGLLPKEKRSHNGIATTSPISLESLTFHLSIVIAAAFGGYLMSRAGKLISPTLELPVFSCAFIIGLLLKLAFDKTKVSEYVDPQTSSSISNCATDLLVAFGISSIKLSVVFKYAVPLAVLLAVGLIVTLVTVFVVGKRVHNGEWFEKSIFAWGWWTGTMAMGIVLLRIVDPERRSTILDDYALAYLPCAPIEILLLSIVPVCFMNGSGLWLSLGCLAISLMIIIPAILKRKA